METEDDFSAETQIFGVGEGGTHLLEMKKEETIVMERLGRNGHQIIGPDQGLSGVCCITFHNDHMIL